MRTWLFSYCKSDYVNIIPRRLGKSFNRPQKQQISVPQTVTLLAAWIGLAGSQEADGGRRGERPTNSGVTVIDVLPFRGAEVGNAAHRQEGNLG